MKQNITIEAEGLELILKNKAGDHVIIPKKYRTEVQGMIKDGCHGCIDSLVETLPTMNDYAEDGSLLPDWDKIKSTLNPKNWGVTDYTNKFPDKDKAFAAARKAGEKEYLYKGVRYPVVLKNLPGKIIKERDDFKGTIFTSPEKKGKYDNSRVKAPHGNPDNSKHGDLFNYYKGQPLIAGTHNLQVSRYRPEDETNPNSKYISIQNDDFKDAIVYYGNNYYKEIGKANRLSYMKTPDGKVDNKLRPFTDLGKFKLKMLKDDRGEYIQYYDIWDYSRNNSPDVTKTDNLGQTKPFEVYDRIYVKDYGDGEKKRMYYSDKELSELDVNKKNFDTLALQRELSNRGYKLPKSIKEDGTFDGTWGEETKTILLDYQSKNKNNYEL